MPTFKVKVKWGKEVYNDVEANTDEDPLVFKAQLFALTGVQPERQKVMIKGGTLKDSDWGNIKLTNGAMVLMMGTREEDVPTEPTVRPVFVEDMNQAELATAMDLPAGLSNLGNTCYMNATVQCLKTVPELREALLKFTGGVVQGSMVPSQAVTAALRDLYDSMDKGPWSNNIPPIILLQVLHTAFPRFAEKTDNGTFMQQDANECWTEIVRMLQQKLPGKGSGELVSSNTRSFIDQFFGGVLDVTLKCTESEDEPPTNSEENFLQLSCFIDQDVKYMQGGLKSKMEEKLTKHSPTLNRDAEYLKTSKIKRLPGYLTVSFVRFCFKGKAGVNAKVLRDVKFPMEYDAFELCTKELQDKLAPMRERFKQLEDKEVEEATSFKEKTGSSKGDNDKHLTKQVPYWFEDDLGSNNSGYYQLQAVLTHKGRSTNSGHYVAWVRQKEDRWVKCDDDQVIPVTSEEVLKLSGGGDWHIAYVLLYGPRILKLPIESQTLSAVSSDSSAAQITES